MRFDNIKVCGHRRTGTHYAAAVISTNFLGSDDYLKIYEKHKTPKKLNVTKNPKTAYIVVTRNFEDTAKSIYIMRKRFGLKTKDYKTFLITNYKKMWSKDVGKFTIKMDTLNTTKIIQKSGGGLKNIDMTPKKYWNSYYKLWKPEKNVFILSYDKLINDFNITMEELSLWLASDKKKFSSISKKVGWRIVK